MKSKCIVCGKPVAGFRANPRGDGPWHKACEERAAAKTNGPKSSERKPARKRSPAPAAVVSATKAELKLLEQRRPGISKGAMAAAALAIARELDSARNSATSKSMCARELRETMTKLAELAPPVEEEDGIDDLAERRATRKAKATKPATKKPARRAAT